MKPNIKYSILELAIVSEGTGFKGALQNALVIAKVAEANGFERIWFAEHHNSVNVASNAPTVLMGYVAENTQRIRVGSGGVMLPNHSPLVVAEQFGTLAHLYPNRIDLGLGRAPGTDMTTAQAIRSDFMQAAQSFPNEIYKIENYFSENNRDSKVRAAIAEGVEVPIYILGSSTDSAHLAAAKGLPYAFASHFATTHLHQALQIYKHQFQPSDVLSKPYTIAGVNIIIADTNDKAEALFTSLIGMFYGLLTGNMKALQPPTAMTDEWRSILNHPAVNQMLKYSFVGNKQRVKSQVEAFLKETGVNELIIVSTIFDINDRIKSTELFAEVMQDINKV